MELPRKCFSIIRKTAEKSPWYRWIHFVTSTSSVKKMYLSVLDYWSSTARYEKLQNLHNTASTRSEQLTLGGRFFTFGNSEGKLLSNAYFRQTPINNNINISYSNRRNTKDTKKNHNTTDKRENSSKGPKKHELKTADHANRGSIIYRGWVRSAMATRKGINVSGNYAATHNTKCLVRVCTLHFKKMNGRTKSYFTFFLKLNDHPARCFNFGLSRIHPNGCMSEFNF